MNAQVFYPMRSRFVVHGATVATFSNPMIDRQRAGFGLCTMPGQILQPQDAPSTSYSLVPSADFRSALVLAPVNTGKPQTWSSPWNGPVQRPSKWLVLDELVAHD